VAQIHETRKDKIEVGSVELWYILFRLGKTDVVFEKKCGWGPWKRRKLVSSEGGWGGHDEDWDITAVCRTTSMLVDKCISQSS